MRPTDPRVLSALAPARRPLVGMVGAGVIGSLLVITQAFVVTGLVVAALGGGHLLRWAVLVALTLAARALVGYAGDRSAARAAAVVGTDLRRRITEATLRDVGPMASSGGTAVLLTRGVSAAEPYLTRYLPALVLAAVLPIVSVVVIATQDLLSAVIVLATLPLIPLFGALVGLATRDQAASQWRSMAALSGHFVDVMRGLPTLVAFRRAHAQAATIRLITERYREATRRTLRLAFLSSAVLELVATLSVALVAVVVGVRLAAGHLDLRTALVVLLLAPEAYWPLRRVGAEFHAAAEGVATFEQAAEILAVAEVVPDLDPGPGALVLDRLTVRYAGRTAPALDAVSAVIAPVGVTALAGPSGCGKSTLLAALAGLVETSGGTIHVGRRTPSGEGWRARIAWLPQRPVFVSGSVADNLRLAVPEAADADLWEVLRRVALEEVVRALPAGLDAPVGEDGRCFSAGERARLALARVVLARRPWVFLDEPTAHLDPLTERIIADVIVELGTTSGVVVVAHTAPVLALAQHVVRLPAAERALPVAPAEATTTAVTPSQDAAPTIVRRRYPFAASTAIAALASGSGVALTATAGWLIVQASLHPPVLTLLVAIVGVRTFGLARPVLRYVERLRSHDAALALLAERRVQIYEAVVPLVPGALGVRRGDVLTSVVDDVDSVLDRELRVRMPVRSALLVAGAAVVTASVLAPVAGAVLTLTLLVGAGLGSVVARAAGARAERNAVAARAALSERVVEVLQVAPELVMWQAQGRAVDAVVGLSRTLTDAVARAARAVAGARALVLLATGLGVAATALVTAPLVVDGSLSRPMLALLVLHPLALADVVLPVVEAGALAARTDAADVRLRALAETPPAVLDPATPVPVDGSTLLTVDRATVVRGATVALSDVSLDLAPGERLGVVGPSGSGKSTLAALLLRFVDPSAGEVRLGGVPVERLALDDVRRSVGLVDDDPHVFATTLVENIRLGRPSATDADVETALRRARLGAWLDSLPTGLDTWLGDGHAQVSGGERARIGLARCLLADAPVLVLDEPTAHLDSQTASEVCDDLLGATDGRSVVWITHGTLGLDRMDRVLDLDDLTVGPRVGSRT